MNKTMPYQLYRCATDNKLVFPNEMAEHNGHRLHIAYNGTLMEYLRVCWKKYRGELKRRESYQA